MIDSESDPYESQQESEGSNLSEDNETSNDQEADLLDNFDAIS